MPLPIFAEPSSLDVWQGSEYAVDMPPALKSARIMLGTYLLTPGVHKNVAHT